MAHRGFLIGTAAALGAALVALGAFLSAGAEPAEAAFPGENGKITYHAANILYWDLDLPETDAEDIWVAEPDGSGRENLTNTPEVDELYPTFSPNGERIAFVRGWDVWVMGSDGTGQENLTNTPGVGESYPTFSPDGERVAFVREGDIWVMEADGAGQENLTNTPGYYNDSSPAWSPDGTRIAFDRFDLGPGGKDVWVMDSDGTDQESLTGPFDEGHHGSDEWDPSFSPDGKTIAFTAYVESSCTQNIFTMDAGGSAWTNLTRIPDQSCPDQGGGRFAGAPAYSPDGRMMAFVTGSYSSGVALMNSDGSGQRHLYLDPDPDDEYWDYYASFPDWQPVCPCPRVPPPDDTDPTVTRPRPAPGSEVRDRTPTVRAVVRDETSELAKSDITLRVDGRARGFSYDADTDRLSRATKKLSYGRHTVKITANDETGNATTERWSFRVAKRR